MYPKEKGLSNHPQNSNSKLLPSHYATKFIERLESLGLGSVISKHHAHTKKNYVVFRKRKFEEMDQKAKDICKYLKIGTAAVNGNDAQ